MSKKSVDDIRVVLLAHVFVGRTELVIKNDPIINGIDSSNSTNQNTKILKSVAQNNITITRVSGKISHISTDTKKNIKILRTINKYNGVIFIIDNILKPVKTDFILPEKSDMDDVLTIFDINKATMEIRKAQFDVNRHNQEQSIKLIQFIAQSSVKLHREITQLSDTKGLKLINDSNEFMDLFYTRQVPCEKECVRMDKLAEDLRKQNLEFEKILRQSNCLAALKISFEQMMLNLSKIDQTLHKSEDNNKSN